MTAGTMFAIWLGELISEFGIRNQGLSLIIFAGIVSRIPRLILAIVWLMKQNRWFGLVFMLVLTTLVDLCHRVCPARPPQCPGDVSRAAGGRRMSMPVKGTLPLMVNMAGMIPIIFAQSLLTFPAIIASFFLRSATDWRGELCQAVSEHVWRQRQCLLDHVLLDGGPVLLLLHRCSVCTAELW